MENENRVKAAIEIARMEHEEEKLLFQLTIGGFISLMIASTIIALQREISFVYISILLLYLIFLTSVGYSILRERMKIIRAKLKDEIKEMIK